MSAISSDSAEMSSSCFGTTGGSRSAKVWALSRAILTARIGHGLPNVNGGGAISGAEELVAREEVVVRPDLAPSGAHEPPALRHALAHLRRELAPEVGHDV